MMGGADINLPNFLTHDLDKIECDCHLGGDLSGAIAVQVDYTSPELRSQIHIEVVNWGLLAAVLFVMLLFRESHRLASAYGLAVTGTMALTGVLMTAIFVCRHRYGHAALVWGITLLDFAFLGASLSKL